MRRRPSRPVACSPDARSAHAPGRSRPQPVRHVYRRAPLPHSGGAAGDGRGSSGPASRRAARPAGRTRVDRARGAIRARSSRPVALVAPLRSVALRPRVPAASSGDPGRRSHEDRSREIRDGRHAVRGDHGGCTFGARRGAIAGAAPSRARRDEASARPAAAADQEAGGSHREAERGAPDGAFRAAGEDRDRDHGRGAPEEGSHREHHATHPAVAHRREQDLPVTVQPGDRPDRRHGRVLQGAARRQLRAALGRARLVGVRRSVRARLGHHHRVERGLRAGGGRDRHHLAAVQPLRAGGSLLRGLRAALQVSRPRPALREPAGGARRVRRRREPGGRRAGQLARADRPVPDAHRRHVQQDRRRQRAREQPHVAPALRLHLPRPRGHVLLAHRRQQRRSRPLVRRHAARRRGYSESRDISAISISPTAGSRSPRADTAASSGAPRCW